MLTYIPSSFVRTLANLQGKNGCLVQQIVSCVFAVLAMFLGKILAILRKTCEIFCPFFPLWEQGGVGKNGRKFHTSFLFSHLCRRRRR